MSQKSKNSSETYWYGVGPSNCARKSRAEKLELTIFAYFRFTMQLLIAMMVGVMFYMQVFEGTTFAKNVMEDMMLVVLIGAFTEIVSFFFMLGGK